MRFGAGRSVDDAQEIDWTARLFHDDVLPEALVELTEAIVRHGGIQVVNGMIHLVAFQEHTIEDPLLIAALAFRVEVIAQLRPDIEDGIQPHKRPDPVDEHSPEPSGKPGGSEDDGPEAGKSDGLRSILTESGDRVADEHVARVSDQRSDEHNPRSMVSPSLGQLECLVEIVKAIGRLPLEI